MLYRWMILSLVCMATATGCLGSESHWGDDSSKNGSTNNGSTNNGSTSNNATTGNNTATNNTSGNNSTDAGQNNDGGMPTECVAYRQRDDLSLSRARCYQADPAGFECTCFDATQSTPSTAATCEAALINDCGAEQSLLVDEIGSCTVANRNAGSFTAACVETDGGWNCACDLETNAVFVDDPDCFEAAWTACYAQTPAECGTDADTCSNSGPYSYDCSCENYGARTIEAPFCEDALEGCTADVAIDGCTGATGYCNRDEENRWFECTCNGGSTTEVPFGDSCENVLAATCAG